MVNGKKMNNLSLNIVDGSVMSLGHLMLRSFVLALEFVSFIIASTQHRIIIKRLFSKSGEVFITSVENNGASTSVEITSRRMRVAS